jgi:hypothetical protein
MKLPKMKKPKIPRLAINKNLADQTQTAVNEDEAAENIINLTDARMNTV